MRLLNSFGPNPRMVRMFLLEKGMLDMVVERTRMRPALISFLRFMLPIRGDLVPGQG